MRIWQSWIIPALGISGSVLFGGCADQTAPKGGSVAIGTKEGKLVQAPKAHRDAVPKKAATQDEEQLSDAEAETEPTPLARLEAVEVALFRHMALDQQALVARLREIVNGIQRRGVAGLGLNDLRTRAEEVVGLLNNFAISRRRAERGRDSVQQVGLQPEENSFITILNDVDQLRETTERLGQDIAQRIRQLEEVEEIRATLRQQAIRQQGAIAEARASIDMMERARGDETLNREVLAEYAESAQRLLDTVTLLGADADRYRVMAGEIGLVRDMNPFTALVGEFAQLRRDIEQIHQEFSDRLRLIDVRDLAAVAV